MPMLGRLFGSKKNDEEKTEIVLSITPRVIRRQPRPASEYTEFWYGTETSLRSAPLASVTSAPSTGTLRASTTSGAAAGTSAPSAAAPANAANTGGGVPPERLSLTWDGPGQVAAGDSFEVQLRVNSAAEIASLRSRLRFDQVALELTSVDVGDFIPSSVQSSVTPNILERAGRMEFDVASMDGAAASGDGTLVTLHFRALTPRPGTMIAVQQFSAQGTDGLAVPVMAPKPFVTIITQ
jgi:general secretion pathway protein D